MAELISQELDLDIQAAEFYTDSNIVLGYINNTSQRFYIYVADQVIRIRKSHTQSSGIMRPPTTIQQTTPLDLFQEVFWSTPLGSVVLHSSSMWKQVKSWSRQQGSSSLWILRLTAIYGHKSPPFQPKLRENVSAHNALGIFQ